MDITLILVPSRTQAAGSVLDICAPSRYQAVVRVAVLPSRQNLLVHVVLSPWFPFTSPVADPVDRMNPGAEMAKACSLLNVSSLFEFSGLVCSIRCTVLN